MSHPNDGLLRLLVDAADEVSTEALAHVAACSLCRRRLAEVRATAAAAGRVLRPPALTVSPEVALTRIRAAATARPARRAALLNVVSCPHMGWRYRLPAVLVATVMVTLLASVVTGWARGLIVVFQRPQHVVVIPVRPQDLSGLDSLADYGTVTFSNGATMHAVPSAAAAQSEAGFAPLAPGTLPPGVPATPAYRVLPAYTAVFTFNGAKARRVAADHGRSVAPMPADIDGASVMVDVGPVVFVDYGTGAQGRGLLGTVRMPSPVVRTSGVSIARLQSYLLSQPGMSPALAAPIRSIDHPADTLPLLVLSASGRSQAVQVQGSQGSLLRGSSTYGTLITWLKGGYVDAVYGDLSSDQLLTAADSSA